MNRLLIAEGGYDRAGPDGGRTPDRRWVDGTSDYGRTPDPTREKFVGQKPRIRRQSS
jgi:hypothetical protein